MGINCLSKKDVVGSRGRVDEQRERKNVYSIKTAKKEGGK